MNYQMEKFNYLAQIVGSICLLPPYVITFTFIQDFIWSKQAKKFERGNSQFNFIIQSIFMTSFGNFYIDVMNGEIAMITKLNPFQVQIVDASKIEKAWTNDGASKRLYGGTRKVSFCFIIDDKEWKIPTFTSDKRSYSLTEKKIMEAISKADEQVRFIELAKLVAEEKMENAF
jgi:hypothetical protein